MAIKKLHIVSFDVPFPADYGGAIDVFYRIKALHKIGVQITLHCFEYGRGQQKELEQYCSEVFYYKRNIFSSVFSKDPFIVASRKSPELLVNLLKDDSPILFEGLHTCAYISSEKLKKRLKIARTHNIEHDYYQELSALSQGWRKLFFKKEAKKLKAFEVNLKFSDHILAIQKNDASHFKMYTENVHLLPASIPELDKKYNPNTKPFCLFHGNLSVGENENAVRWILKNVTFPKGLFLVVAGKNPSSDIKSACAQLEVELIINPSENEMQQLIDSAQIHLLYTEQETGIKLKLLNTLASSGHVLLNDKMTEGTSLKKWCSIANTAQEFNQKIIDLSAESISEESFNQRLKFLKENFDTESNCKLLFDKF